MYMTFNVRSRGVIAIVAVLVVILAVSLLPGVFRESAAAADGKVAYLTFDDGPSNITPELLAVLREHNVKATFFVSGQYEEYLPILKQIYEDGHVIALHSYTHRYQQIYKSTEAFWSDIARLEEAVLRETGQPAAKILRFPGGSSNTICSRKIMRTLIGQCVEKGYVYFDWNVDTRDALGSDAKSVSYIVERALDGVDAAPDPPVILMHDGPQQTTVAQAADDLIRALTDLGYGFDTLNHLTTPVHHNLPG